MAFGTAKRFAKGSCMCFSKFGSPEVGVKIVTFAWKNFIFRGHMGPHFLRATTPFPPPLNRFAKKYFFLFEVYH